MPKLIPRRTAYDLAVLAALVCAMAALLVFPAQSIDAAKNGLALCFNVIIPSLFPFFVLSSLTVELGLAGYFGRLLEPVMRPLFNVGGACSAAFVLGFIGGYPVGAKTAIALYENGNCPKEEAERLLAFCNNSGPAFILGVVGSGVFLSSGVGLLLYLVHTVSSVIVGVLFRNYGKKRGVREARGAAQVTSVRFTQAFTDAVKNSFMSTLSICAFVVFFAVAIRLMSLSGVIPVLAAVMGKVFSPLGLDAGLSEKLLTGFLEISSGVWSLRGVAGQSGIPLAAFMLGWAGLSVHCQVLSFIGGSGLKMRSYILGKTLHGVISACLTFLLTRVISFSLPVSSYLSERVADMASSDFLRSFLFSALSAAVVWTVLVCCLGAGRRGAENSGLTFKNRRSE